MQLKDNEAGALCYILGAISGLVFLLLEPYSKNRQVRFHAFQAILLHAAFFLIYFVPGLMMPFGMAFLMGRVILLGGMAVWLLVMWKTYQNQRLVLPIIGPIAEKQV